MKIPLVMMTTAALVATVAAPQERPSAAWVDAFTVGPADLSTVGRNTYFILEPGYQLTLEGREGGKAIRLVVSILTDTKVVGGFETRVLEERETSDGKLSEVSRNYVAIDRKTGDVYYFGEDVDVYAGGKVVSHEGAWLHGASGARFGLMMPGKPKVGQRYYQEIAPKVAMDRAEVVSLTDRLTTPAGAFENCLRTQETTPLEPRDKEFKIHAPGVGLVKDGSLILVARPEPPGARR
jgi:hypothetical protein